MGVTASESFLHSLAQRTFLKLWSVPNPFRAAGKELSDLVIVFGDDIVIFSDKACDFGPGMDLQTEWERWRREAIDGSVKQLKRRSSASLGWRYGHFPRCERKEPVTISAAVP